MEGFHKALERHNLLTGSVAIQAESLQFPGGSKEVMLLLNRVPRPDGVIVFNDQLAIGVLDGISKSGYTVGKDILVIGFDNLQISALPQIDLTTITPSKKELGKAAVDLVLRRRRNPDAERKIIEISSRMVIRGTA